MTALLSIDDLSVTFGGLRAVDGVSVTVLPQEIRGLIGPNGAGKTTLFNTITGLVPAAGGRIVFDGAAITELPPQERARRGARRTFQSVQLLPGLTVLENVLLGLHCEEGDGVLGSLWKVLTRRASDRSQLATAREVLSFLGLDDQRMTVVDKLSFSQQRFVEIARAIVSRPKLLLLDEPAAGLSPSDIEMLREVILRIRDDRNTTIILVEHILSLVMAVCDKVTVMEQGKLLVEGEPQAIMRHPAVQAAYLGEE